VSGIVGEPLLPTAVQRRWWGERMSALDFDPAVNFIAPERARANPLVAIRARLAVLLATYRDDYHTDSFDLERLCRRVEDEEEAIAFWGEPAAVARLGGWLDSASAVPDDSELARLELGTATSIDVGERFGPGHRELCRGGSVCRTVSSIGATLSSLLRFFAADAHDDFHTIVSTVRNRRSEPDVAGGAAIHRLYTREIKSSFWGFAPWYVMQGGVLELLDYREIYRDGDAVHAAILRGGPISLCDEDEANLVESLLELNLRPSALRPAVELGEATGSATSGWRLEVGEGDDLIAFNQVGVQPAPEDGLPLVELLNTPLARAAACVVARLPLSAAHGADQALLRDHGFRLSAMSPPKGVRREPFVGFWSRPRSGLGVAEPYYFGSSLLDSAEERLVECGGKVVGEWTGSALTASR